MKNTPYKKGMITMAFLVVLLFFGIPTGRAAGEPELVIQPMHTTVNEVGGNFSISIWLNLTSPLPFVYGYIARIVYNTTILNCTAAGTLPGHPFEGKAGGFLKDIEDPSGYLLVQFYLQESGDYVNVTETAPLCYINFTGTALGSSTLAFDKINQAGGTYLMNSTGQKIPFNTTPGNDVIVLPEFSVFAALMFMATMIITVVLVKKRWVKLPIK